MAGGLRTRRDVWELSAGDPWPPVLLGYARAVRAMQERPRSSPTSWSYLAAVHGSDDPPPRGARWNECKHGSWFFLPWHRLYLDHFERIVRSVVVEQGGNEAWALPYWNFEAPGADSLPPAFRLRTLPDGRTPNPLYVSQRAPGVNRGGRVPVAQLSSGPALADRSFTPPPGAGFGGGRSGPLQFASAYGDLERTPHNDIHVLIGGTGLMGDPNRAALDPIFWLHHANIDRLWAEWIALGGGRINPGDQAWRRQRFPFVDERGTLVRRTVPQSLSITALGYTYDTLDREGPPAEPASPGVPADHREDTMELVGASEEAVDLVGGSASVNVAIDRRAAQSVLADQEAAAPGHVYLALEDIEGDRNPGVVYEVHLMGAKPKGRRRSKDRHVGNVSFFGIEHATRPDGHGHGGHGMRHVYDVTELVGGLRASGEWDDATVRVEFRPLGLLAPVAGGDEGDDGGEDEAELPATPIAVRVGRVSLFFE